MPQTAPFFPETAPFTPEQRAWMNGLFAAMAGEQAHPGFENGGVPSSASPGDAHAGPSGARRVASDGLPASLAALAACTTPVYDRTAYVAARPMHDRTKAVDDGAGRIHDRTNPFPARLRCCRPLNRESSAKDTRHVEISLDGSGLAYEVGDALGIYPRNCPELGERFMDALRLNPDDTVTLAGEVLTLREALDIHRDITSVPDAFLKAVAERTGALRELLEPERRHEKTAFLEGRACLDLVQAFPDLAFHPQELVDLLRPVRHRLYSISSSPKAYPDAVHLTVGVVRYLVHDRFRKGVCSTYLSERLEEGDTVPVFIHRNPSFRLPADGERPVIMIGPGTGIAPFRAFLQERRATGARGRNWLFFGDQHAATDFLYRDELEEMRAAGILDRLSTAFSRDQEEKVYVQHRMLEHAGELYDWLEEGAHFYVCGDAARMAKDVDAALHRVVEIAGGLTAEAGVDYVRRLKREKRYVRDVY